MPPTVEATEAVSAPQDKGSGFRAAYRWMLLARLLDEKIASLYKAGKITGGVFLGKGQEALSAAIGVSLIKGDVFSPLIRDLAGRLAFGEPVLDCTRTFMGVRSGPMRGRDGNVHRGRPREGILPMISHLGAMVSVVNGILMARRFKGLPGSVGVASLGEGATSTGAFHEGINQAAVEGLPLVVVVANNQYAYSTPNNRQFACLELIDKAQGYGVQGCTADGTDLESCLEVVSGAISRARAGLGPQLVVAPLLRLTGHGEHDDAHYIDPALRKEKVGQDCLTVAEATLQRHGWLENGDVLDLRLQVQREVDDAVAITMREALPDPGEENWCAISSSHLADVYTLE